jgi:adenine-specific DNA-methyltransferase
MSKIDDAIEILEKLGFPNAQQNERSALSLLALVQLKKNGSWQSLKNPMLGVRAILDFCRNDYKKPYAENSRESFRKETLHQFVSAGLALQNPDYPTRAPNSPKWCYQISPNAKELLVTYGTPAWKKTLINYLASVETLADKYKMVRDMSRIPCKLPDGAAFHLSPGYHSVLIRDIIEQFAPRFAPGCKVVYVGDTGSKGVIFDEAYLSTLGVVVHERGKMPDVVLHYEEKGWLFLIESVTSVGPMDGKRHAELANLFGSSSAGLVFVSAFPNRTLMAKYLADLAWETEVWIAEDPDHLIHFNGDRFLGPHLMR